MTRHSRLRMIFFSMAMASLMVLLGVPVASAQTPVADSAIVPVSKTDAGWQNRFKQFNERVKQGNVDLLFIGDSITHGWEGEGKDIWAQYYGKRNAVNLGIGGDKTQHVLWRLDNGNIDGIQPKLAVLMIGTNNYKANTAEEIADGVKVIVKDLRTKLPKTKVLVLAIFPRGEKPDATREKLAKASALISKTADNRKVFFMDIGTFFTNIDGSLSKAIMPDFLHLTPEGYNRWAQAIEPMVAKLTKTPEVVAATNTAIVPVARTSASWQERNNKFNARIKEGNVDLLFIGDSITHAWESGGKEVWAQYYEKRNTVNLGISGDQTQHVLWRLDNGNIDGINPKLAVIMIGTNNVMVNTSDEIGEGITAIVNKLRTKLPNTKVLVLAIFPRGEKNDEMRAKLARASKIASKTADKKMVFFLDINKVFLNRDKTMSKEIMPDYLHPTPEGYARWAKAIEPKVAKFMGVKRIVNKKEH